MKSLFTAVAVSMLLTLSAYAGETQKVEEAIETAETTLEAVNETEFAPVADTYAALDADGSGTLSATEAEVIPALTENWEALDVDASGELDIEEFAAFELVEEEETPLEQVIEEVQEEIAAE